MSGPVQTLIVLADAAAATGMGHWVRSAALADELDSRGWSVRVVHRTDAVERAVADVRGRGWSVQIEDWTPDSLRGRQDWSGREVVLVDSYRVDAGTISALRSMAGAVVVVDDLADRGPLDADLVVNQNLGADRTRYSVDEGTQLLLGPKYSLLRPQFAQARPSGLERVRAEVAVERVLVMMGGNDATGALPTVVEAALTALPDAQIQAIVAPEAAGNLHRHAWSKRLECLSPTPEIATEMVRADLVISAGGTSVWELCATARPFGVVVVADNQVEATTFLERAGASRIVGTRPLHPERLAERIAALAADRAALGKQARAAAALVDGAGCTRVADRIELLERNGRRSTTTRRTER